ncbi:MAG TPA: heavy metal translocating P-type ATPase [Patescibacteria group bacterium]|nr:heavy metal translocating P-type ATPase [Patescibacteria group bacterium]
MKQEQKEKNQAYLIPALALAGLVIAGLCQMAGAEQTVSYVLLTALILGTIPLAWRIIKDLFSGHYGVDIIAIAAIVASFFLRQYLAGTVVLLMLSGGEALEDYALRRARQELTSLISRAPAIAHRREGDRLKDMPAGQIKTGDMIVVKPGEVVPVDGIVMDGVSEIDESALTGEPLPVPVRPASRILSGSLNKHNPLEIRAIRPAAESKYEQIIKLVRQAEESRAPVVRLADRYSVWFTALTVIAAAAAWLMARDPVRLLAVLVVATPCPLILATPIAIMSGISRSASRGIVVKNGGALEQLAEVRALIFDKTGTLTVGLPEFIGAESFGNLPESEIIRLSASLDQMSAHVLAAALARQAGKTAGLKLDYPENFRENFGDGVSGELAGKKYFFGKLSFIRQQGIAIGENTVAHHETVQSRGHVAVYLADDQQLLGAVKFADVPRPEIKKLFTSLRGQGIRHVVMLTGDKQAVAEKVAAQIGISDIHAEALPEDKVFEVKEHQKQFGAVAMIGDGINDAPALAAADVGIAMGGHGSTAASDTGDIVITVNNLSRIGVALKIAKRVMFIAREGIFLGMGVSVFLMVLAALGYIQPVYGAMLQELLDVAVILNALRVNFAREK